MEEQGKLPASAANAYTQVHEVVAGDTLGKIAVRVYGSSKRYLDIYQANLASVGPPPSYWVRPGQKLVIPR